MSGFVCTICDFEYLDYPGFRGLRLLDINTLNIIPDMNPTKAHQL